jgi:hypothetical protein
LAYTLGHQREIPLGFFVCHYCDNPPCCNPWHLFLGNHVLNVQDMVQKKRHTWGESHPFATTTAQQVIAIRFLLSQHLQGRVIARQVGVSEHVVSKIKRGTSRKHG